MILRDIFGKRTEVCFTVHPALPVDAGILQGAALLRGEVQIGALIGVAGLVVIGDLCP